MTTAGVAGASGRDGRARWESPATRSAAGAALALVGLVALSLAIAGDPAPRWEHDVVVASTDVPTVLGLPARVPMVLATRWAMPVVALVLYLVTRSRRAALGTLVAGFAAASTIGFLKDWVERPRPDGVRLRDHAGGFGFPSGHTATAFAVAAALAPHLPRRWRWLPFALAAAVGWARMHVGVHYPVDVAGGALWGLAVGWTLAALPWFRPGEPPPTPSTRM
jgi:glycosyltransferase 2 family protein